MLFFRFQFALRPGHASGKVPGVFKTKWPCLARTKMGPDLLSTAVRSDSYSAAPPPLSFYCSNERTNQCWPPTSDKNHKNHPEKPNPNAPPRTFQQKRPGCFSDFQSIRRQEKYRKTGLEKTQQPTKKSFQLEVGVGCYLVGYLVWLCIPGEQRFADLGPLGVQFLSLVSNQRTTHLSGTVSRSIPTKKNQRSKSLIKSFYLGGQGNRKTLSQKNMKLKPTKFDLDELTFTFYWSFWAPCFLKLWILPAGWCHVTPEVIARRNHLRSYVRWSIGVVNVNWNYFGPRWGWDEIFGVDIFWM